MDGGGSGSGSDVMPDAIFTGDPLIGVGTVELVDMGYMFTEGPQWRETQGDLLFSDIPDNKIFKYLAPDSLTIHRMPSGNSNGLAIDAIGAVLAAEHGSRSITRDGTLVVGTYMGDQLNSPNDVISTEKGIYFTDPPYGLPGGNPANSATGFMGVYFLPTGGALVAEHMGALTERPNGIGISPDGTRVYVADTSDGNVYTFPVNTTDGTLGTRAMFADTTGGADGLAIDAAGNVFVASSSGIEVFSPAGTKWGTITVPMQPANCAFGDADHKTLYITARTSLYRVRLVNVGLPNN
jgi:gluconolactonase